MAVDLTAYPDEEDVQLLLQSAKLWPADSDSAGQALALQQAEIAALGAKAEFERMTGWLPFLAGPSATTRTFDATDFNGVLDLHGGLLSSPTVTVSGSAYTVDTNFYLDPANAAGQGKAWTSLRFWGHIAPGRPNQISVTGRFGYCTSLPADVWQAIQKYAGVLTLMSIENRPNPGSIVQDGFSKSWDVVGVISQTKILDTWGKDWNGAVRRYVRVTV